MAQGSLDEQRLEQLHPQLQRLDPLAQQQQQQQQQQPPLPPPLASAGHVQQPGDTAMLDMPAGDQDIRNAERKRSVSFKVPSGVAGLIVGKKGVNIKKFKQQAGVKIALPYGEGAEKTAPLKTVVIEGAAPKVDAGIAMLCEILSAWAEKDETGTAEHQVPSLPERERERERERMRERERERE